MDCQFKKIKSNTKFTPMQSTSIGKVPTERVSPHTVKVAPTPPNPKQALFEQRRALGRYFKCGDRYYLGHRCKVKLQLVMGHDDTKVLVSSSPLEEMMSQATDEQAEEVIVFMHATSNNPTYNTMKLKGQIGTVPVFTLIDSGSTHSFVNPSVLQDGIHHIVTTNPMIVMAANGDRMVTDSKCSALRFLIQGHKFEHDLRVLPVTDYDVILDLGWLAKFGPMRVD
jgi:Retroviral aspartyl protease